MREFIKRAVWLLLFAIGSSVATHAQEGSTIELSINTEAFPRFRIDQTSFSQSLSYGIQVSYYDEEFTPLRFSLNYARGYHQTVSYSTGLSAGYVILFTDRFSLTPGFGVTDFKMRDRNCRISFYSVMNSLFGSYDSCYDDSHISLNPFIEAELKLSEPLSVVFQATYRAMLSHIRYLTETVTDDLPGGGTIEQEIYRYENSFYGAGPGFGVALRVGLF